MDLVELRDLDGPNIFLLEPAIKLEVATAEGEAFDLDAFARQLGIQGDITKTDRASADRSTVSAALVQATAHLHRLSGTAVPRVVVQPLETPGHLAVAFGWQHRRFAIQLARDVGDAIDGKHVDLDAVVTRLRSLRESVATDDRPLMIRDADRRLRSIAVTGTNGKTTTTRLIAHILRVAGLRVGWCSSSGVYIEGNEVLEGDYSGPSGARRVLLEPDLDAGVLETARGGILLRGVAYESNDVSVFTNVSADHLDLQGVRTVEGLARVKAVVVRVTKADGYAVLNADDPLVIGATGDIRASRFLFSQQTLNPHVNEHRSTGGRALLANDRAIILVQGDERRPFTELRDVPITYGGTARHMVENALAATAACLAFGISEEHVRAGLTSFANTPECNVGRLNVFKVDDVTVIVDYAHNEAGLMHLLAFARRYCGPSGRLISIIGTAGDRTEQSLREIGRIAATESDAVIVKGTERYQRGRALDDMIALYCEGIRLAGSKPLAIDRLEFPALLTALDLARGGDVIAIMAQEQIPEIIHHLRHLGGAPRSGNQSLEP